ncbi:MAG: peroxiredoxin [Porticoccaceae bacterium]|nr:peroxiredoxin [Porticoccaceae bacterium]|tara:strand:- start:2536 stop:3012 length:477 start_codon:yes stop_codon:yes gene_type:complete
MMIRVGDLVPDGDLTAMGDLGPEQVSFRALARNRKVLLIGVEGAFTPNCTSQHLPGYITHADALQNKGIDKIFCLSMNDIFVMTAWSEATNASAIKMLADGNGDFTQSLGLTLDNRVWGMGIRTKRFAMILDDGMVHMIGVDDVGVSASSVDSVLSAL